MASSGLFWDLLERSFPFGGARVELWGWLEGDLVTRLERAGILSPLGRAKKVSCPTMAGHGCPRRVVSVGQRIMGVCDNDPPQCEDVMLHPSDVELLGVIPERLCEVLRGPLGFGGRIEPVFGMRHVYRAGTYTPSRGLHYGIFLAVRCTPGEYAAVFDALRSRQEGDGFAVLVPTSRHLDAVTLRQMRTLGIPIVPLSEIIEFDPSGALRVALGPTRLFQGIAWTSASGRVLPGTVAHVRTHTGWRDLDEDAYQAVRLRAREYDIFADERTRVVLHTVDEVSEQRPGILPSYFPLLRAAILKAGYFDPDTDADPETKAGKQSFQRARLAVDVSYRDGSGRLTWKLFKSVVVDGHAVYQFLPDPDVSFALIFNPRL